MLHFNSHFNSLLSAGKIVTIGPKFTRPWRLQHTQMTGGREAAGSSI
jgi:hypothetical protein